MPNIQVSRWLVESCPKVLEQKIISAVAYREMKGSISDMELCQIFGETVWKSGDNYHTHAVSLHINEEEKRCRVIPRLSIA
ncbi:MULTISPECIES: hypothetical protein [Vibrio]|uniref:Uncharacterized protein n=1 Tax=Vibrio qingdaonensis TaxID=2829491 RepID=A0A9X3HXE9_9VIBR|nr:MULTISPECIES: hypothetical protein [Vibrio]MCL9773130.1 hypothetical protein [Vibrio methylphosphonaticus]MCW8347254.1 hypothetical protein [Vibrio qingdaonensis]